jgi:hypothetical protein
MSGFKTWSVVGILRFQKWLQIFWTLKLSFVGDILTFLAVWATFLKIGLFSNLLVTHVSLEEKQ